MTLPVDPTAFLAALDDDAETIRTSSGAGTVVWRCWGAGPPLVLLHGGSGSWRHWARNITPLAAGRRVIAPDLPGMGDSDLPPGALDRKRIAAIIAEALGAVLGPATRFDLAGFSFGGAVAGLMAGIAPARIRSLTLVGAGGFGAPFEDPPRVSPRRLRGAERVAAHRANLASMMIADPANIDDLALEIQELNTRRVRLPPLADRDRAYLPAGFGAYAGPLNAIWGERDNFIGDRLPSRIETIRTARPDAHTRVLPGIGHWLAYEAADIFNAYLAARLAGLTMPTNDVRV